MNVAGTFTGFQGVNYISLWCVILKTLLSGYIWMIELKKKKEQIIVYLGIGIV